ncbi:MAG: hypothetical protein A2284_14985 [Deltaproteobacteria bacterium RIFOXYA12_FULL_61_11]|nr:MAG: hypothetical protein A2284_14985 [Deltaproteobacteria bacterium RIFOXYA12_FULL_61_11]
MAVESPEPGERRTTLRKDLAELLGRGEYETLELSKLLGIPEREVFDHLEHLRRSLRGRLQIRPAGCRNCGFTFEDRRRLTTPGRCPRCKESRLTRPRFTVRG